MSTQLKHTQLTDETPPMRVCPGRRRRGVVRSAGNAKKGFLGGVDTPRLIPFASENVRCQRAGLHPRQGIVENDWISR